MKKTIAAALCLVVLLLICGTVSAEWIPPWDIRSNTVLPDYPYTWDYEKKPPIEIVNNTPDTTITEEEAHSGYRSLRLEYVKSEWCRGAFFLGQIASAETTYKFSVWIMATEEINLELNQVLEYPNNPVADIKQVLKKKISPKDGWVEISCYLETGDAQVLRAEITLDKAKTVLYYDDFSFYPVSWSFEDKASNGLLNSLTGEISKSEARKGLASGKISYDRDEWMSGGLFFKNVPVQDSSYELTVWVKATEKLDYSLMVDVETVPGVFTQTLLERKTIDPADGWVRLRGSFNTGSAAKFNPYIETTKSKTVFYVDDISLIEKAAGQKVRVKSDGFVNVRSEGSSNGSIVARVNNGDELTSTGRSDTGWYQVVLPDGTTGYITDKYIVPVQ